MNALNSLQTEPRNVTAVCRFRGTGGRHADAAEAWAFELVYYFLRGVGEQPVVQWFPDHPGAEVGVYVVTGLMTTTHPGDHDPVVFDADAPPWDLDFACNPGRRDYLRGLYTERTARFDGRTPGAPPSASAWEQLAVAADAAEHDLSPEAPASAAGPPQHPGEENH